MIADPGRHARLSWPLHGWYSTVQRIDSPREGSAMFAVANLWSKSRGVSVEAVVQRLPSGQGLPGSHQGEAAGATRADKD